MTYLDMIDRLLGSSEYRGIANKNAINSYQPLYSQIDNEGTESAILCTHLNFGMLEYFAELLIKLDYIAYIPFGKIGEKHAENCFRKLGKNISVSNYKKRIMIKALNNHGIEVDKSFNEGLDSFLRYLQSQEQNFEDVESVAATVRIVGGYIDNLVAKGEIVGLRERDDAMEKILDDLWTKIKTSGTKKFNINDFLPQQEKEFTEKQKEYFKYITGLGVTKNTAPKNDRDL